MTPLPLSHTNLSVSPLCFGTAEWGTDTPTSQAEALLTDFLAAGGNFLDTAHVYAFWRPGGVGQSERTVGELVRRLDCRDRVVIATKGGHPDAGLDYPRPADFLSASRLAADIRESLERLGTNTIDLYYLHRDDGHTPAGEIIERLNEHVRARTVRYLGASNWSPARIREANEYAAQNSLQGFVVSQALYSYAVPAMEMTTDPTMRFVDEDTDRFHRETGLPLVAYSAAANGYFAGKPNGYDTPINVARRQRAQIVGEQVGATPTQIAVAWLLHQPFPIYPAFSSGSHDHLREVVEAVSVSLTPEQITYLNTDE